MNPVHEDPTHMDGDDDVDYAVYKLPFTVKDEEGVEWNVRVVADDGEVAVEQYRHRPGERIMRDMARMRPEDARELIRGLEKMAEAADVHNVNAVHEI
jgi:hypothetical protein